MSHIRVLICQVDDAETMTEVAAHDLPGPEREGGKAASTLDELERTTQRTGNAILRDLLQAQWTLLDQQLTDQYLAQAEPGHVQREGQEPITVTSRFGRVQLRRQVCREGEGQGVLAEKVIRPFCTGQGRGRMHLFPTQAAKGYRCCSQPSSHAPSLG
jgi:hypothetical protein